MIRTAISPRLAIRTFENISGRSHHEQALAVFDRLSVLREDLDDRAADIGLDLVHQLHGLDDAQSLSLLDKITDFDVGIRIRVGSPVEGADDR